MIEVTFTDVGSMRARYASAREQRNRKERMVEAGVLFRTLLVQVIRGSHLPCKPTADMENQLIPSIDCRDPRSPTSPSNFRFDDHSTEFGSFKSNF